MALNSHCAQIPYFLKARGLQQGPGDLKIVVIQHQSSEKRGCEHKRVLLHGILWWPVAEGVCSRGARERDRSFESCLVCQKFLKNMNYDK